MWKPIILLASLFVSTGWSSDVIEVNEKEAKEFQESAFIKLMNNLNDGKVPYPFSKLLDSFGTGAREEGNILFVPQGRSLVKESADFHNPRIIVEPISRGENILLNQEKNIFEKERVEWDKNRKKIIEMGIGSGEVYIGFAPNHKALEVISYNPKKPGYDFFVVEDYEEGKTPKVVHNPSLCLSCHQNEAPIFSKFPWHETMGDSANRENLRDLFFSENTRLMDEVRKANPERNSIEGIDLEKKNNKRFSGQQVSTFDILVRGSNQLLLENKVCTSICSDKNSIDCQKTLLKTLFSEQQNYKASPHFKNMIKNLSLVDIKSSVIPNRNPKVPEKGNPQYKKEDEMQYNETSGGLTPVAVNNPDAIDPAFKRPANSELLKLKARVNEEKDQNKKMHIIANACLPVVNLELLFVSEPMTPEILNDPNVEKALKEWPVTKNLVAAVEKALDKKSTTAIELDNGCKQVMPIYQPASITKVIEKLTTDKISQPAKLFEKYCMQCHGGEKAFIPLPLTSPDKMANYMPKFGKTGVEERLKLKIMPPPTMPLQPTEKERAEMIKLMKAMKK